MSIPLREVRNLTQVKKDLTAMHQPMGAEEATEILLYRVTRTHIEVPRQYGLDYCRIHGIPVEDATSPGHPAKFPRIPEPRDYQVGPLDEVLEAIGGYYDFLWRARTGWGKTIGSLITAARKGVTTLVLVDQENLKKQWIEALTTHFGLTLDNIGIIQGPVCKFAGCPVTIAMVQTVSQKRFPPEVYEYFGFLIVDEVHIIGAPTFGKVLRDFTAETRMGVSATPKRKDGLQKTLDYSLGKVRVYIEDEHEKSAVYVVTHPTIYSWYANTSPKIGRFINEIADDASRNMLVAESAVFLYETGRDVLVLGDRIEHLKELMDLCYYLGVPEDEMGLYAGTTPRFGYAKDPNPSRRPKGWTKHEGDENTEPGVYYTPVSLQLISKKTKGLDRIKKEAAIIFGTYGMFSKGTDIPRLTGGVDATPRSEAEQVHGRILRGKMPKRPIWITIQDENSYRSIFSFLGRIAGYLKNNAVLSHWSIEEGKTPCDVRKTKREARDRVAELKSMRIEPNSAGLNTLKIAPPPAKAAMLLVKDIKARIHAGRSSKTGSSRGGSRGK